MDPITHITAGVLQGQAFRGWFRSRWIFLFCVIAAWIPDIDNLIGLNNPELYLIHHRGITHSFLGAFFVALLLAAGFRLFSRSFPLFLALGVAYFGLLIHIFLDLITSYGTQIFSPFTRTRYAVPCVFIIDPFYTISLLVLFAISCLSKKSRRQVAILGLSWLLAYPMLTLGLRMSVEKVLERRFLREGVAYESLHLSPDAFTPILWKVILEKDASYKVSSVNLLGLHKPLSFDNFQKADPKLMEALGRQASFFRTYSWFAVYPIMKTGKRSGDKVITFSDLRFYSTLEFVKRYFRKGAPPFSLAAFVDEKGKLVKYEYLRPGRTKFIQHIE